MHFFSMFVQGQETADEVETVNDEDQHLDIEIEIVAAKIKKKSVNANAKDYLKLRRST